MKPHERQVDSEAASPHAAALLASVLDSVSAHREIATAYVYGSAARGGTTPLSDVDVALLFSLETDDRTRDRISAAVAGHLARSHPGTSFDVRDLDALPLLIQGRVLTEGLRVGGNDEVRRVSFETSVRQRYFDFLPFHRRDVQEGLQSLRRKHLGG